ncbi:hypothetical protein [Aureimonas sp. AU12]|uniref:hypothetical protein n=1 Tax=Aureimonas sp. AU12 TaxID=1638161 RepID=UPI000B245CF4|nr:hypothetical protein [Aureimonas sp. AU12]
MTRSFTAAATLFILGALSTGAFAATATRYDVAVRHPVHPAQTSRVMSEKENKSPGLSAVLAASDGVIYDPATNDARTHGLPNF